MEIGNGIPASYLEYPTFGYIDFDHFVGECNRLLAEHSADTACGLIVHMMPRLLLNPALLDIIPDPAGRHILYEKSIGELTILGHHHPKPVSSRPHDHGRTWAIYGVVSGRTGMHDWQCVEPGNETGPGKVRLLHSYWVMPGEAHCYPTGAIHSHHTHEDSRLIRVEGMNIKRRELQIRGQYFEPVE